jgi:hypothetical protein
MRMQDYIKHGAHETRITCMADYKSGRTWQSDIQVRNWKKYLVS